ncbi:hypothetical protein [Clostridium oryzae]|uniref:Uncharacterized protein n=1 Tax=Clostridium oryzae TaxID=1450648 RepID=A0A1V4IER8_9CLOT|nr:hypothetical protein [Clostridium oryzae]OPJ58426.1 hypothetical protein CLORY_35760 [Clostridium oryzae]
MIFIGNFIKNNDTEWEVGYIHNMPFDPVNGLGKTEEELNQSGAIVESVPTAMVQEGKIAVLVYNPQTKELSYKYIDTEKTKEQLQAEEIESLKTQMLAMQDAVNAALGL